MPGVKHGKRQSQTITHSMDLQVVASKLTFSYFFPVVANGKHLHSSSLTGRADKLNKTDPPRCRFRERSSEV